MHKEFRAKYPHAMITEQKFCKILHTYFRKVTERLLLGEQFGFRNKLGFLKIIRVKRCMSSTNVDGTRKKVVDFGATKIKQRDMTPEQIDNKEHVVYRTNLKFNKIWWHKRTEDSMSKYLTFEERLVDRYGFKPAKDLKLALGSYEGQ